MDLFCPKCGEPVDSDELHDVPGMSYMEAYGKFSLVGCLVFPGARHNEQVNSEAAVVASAVLGILPDDPDAAAGFMEDFLS